MFPIRDLIPHRTVPVVTVGLIILNTIVLFCEVALSDPELERLIYLFGLVPHRFTHPIGVPWHGFPEDYWPFLTSMFLHGGWIHLISNMWTLWIFGDNVEDCMGHLRFLLYYLLCAIAAGLAHTIVNFSSVMCTIGASGAVAGVIAAYLVLFPYSRIVTLVPILFYPFFVQLPAIIFILIWFSTQFYSGTLSLVAPELATPIAWWAHIGGFAVGLLLYRFFVVRPPLPRPAFHPVR